jgi:hypothetical protein
MKGSERTNEWTKARARSRIQAGRFGVTQPAATPATAPFQRPPSMLRRIMS